MEKESLEELKGLIEDLCKKGKAYRAKRMRAGEKSSAYLSGRAVKVCKGQMQGESKELIPNLKTAEIDSSSWSVDGGGGEIYSMQWLNGTEMTPQEIQDWSESNPEEYDDMMYNNSVNEVEAKDNTEFNVSLKHLLKKHVTKGGEIEENVYYVDAVNEHEEYCPVCSKTMLETVKEALNKIDEKKGKCKPSKGKRFAKRVSGKCRSFGQKGKAKKGGDRIRPGTKKGHAYCARSAKIKKCKNPPCANALSRKKWKCQGSRSVK